MSDVIGTRKQYVYQHLRQRMRTGRLLPGDRLAEVELSREMQVSRGPLREAINQLASEGLVHMVPGLGAFIRNPDRKEIIEIYELREATESFVAAKAADRIRSEDLEILERYCDQMHSLLHEYRRGQTWDEAHRQALLEADAGFHAAIARVAGNNRIGKLLEDCRLLQRMLAYQDRLGPVSTLSTRARAWAQHVRVLRALRQHDAEAAGQAMAEHVRTAKRHALATYDALQANQPGT